MKFGLIYNDLSFIFIESSKYPKAFREFAIIK